MDLPDKCHLFVGMQRAASANQVGVSHNICSMYPTDATRSVPTRSMLKL